MGLKMQLPKDEIIVCKGVIHCESHLSLAMQEFVKSELSIYENSINGYRTLISNNIESEGFLAAFKMIVEGVELCHKRWQETLDQYLESNPSGPVMWKGYVFQGVTKLEKFMTYAIEFSKNSHAKMLEVIPEFEELAKKGK
jgi:hypothetical protein